MMKLFVILLLYSPVSSTDTITCIKGDLHNSIPTVTKKTRNIACAITYKWKRSKCVLENYRIRNRPTYEKSHPICKANYFADSVTCLCYESFCNRDLGRFHDYLNDEDMWEGYLEDAEEFANCLLKQSKQDLKRSHSTNYQSTSTSLYCLYGKADDVVHETRGFSRCTVMFKRTAKSCELVEYGVKSTVKETDEAIVACHPQGNSEFVCHCKTDNCNAEFEQFHSSLESLDGGFPFYVCEPRPQCARGDESRVVYHNREPGEFCFISYRLRSSYVKLGKELGSREIKRLNTDSPVCQLKRERVACFCTSDKCNTKDIFQNAVLYDENWKKIDEHDRQYSMLSYLKIRHCGKSITFDVEVCVKRFRKDENGCRKWLSFRRYAIGEDRKGCKLLNGTDYLICVCETGDCSDTSLKDGLAKLNMRIDPAQPDCLIAASTVFTSGINYHCDCRFVHYFLYLSLISLALSLSLTL